MARNRPVGSLLEEVFRRGGMKRGLQRARLVLAWKDVAGRELQRFTNARSVDQGVLYVDTTDSETAMHLTYQKRQFLAAYRKLGLGEIRDIRFQAGHSLPGAEAAPLPPAPPPDPEELDRLRTSVATAQLDGDLARSAMAAAEAIATNRARRRQLGYVACAACPTYIPPGTSLCTSCEIDSRMPAVIRAAGVLRADPTAAAGNLTPEQKRVAAWLAAGQLEKGLLPLVAQVVSDERMRPELERTAAAYVALRSGRSPAELKDSDWKLLPPLVTRVLGPR